MVNKRKLVKNTLLLSVCTIINKGLLFVMLPFFTRWLTLDDYGTYDVYTTFITLLIPCITLATSNAVFRLSLDDESKRDAYITNDILLVIVNTGVVIAGLCVFSFLSGWKYFIPFSFLLVAYVLDDYFQGYLRALKKIDLYAIIKAVGIILIAAISSFFIKALNTGLLGLILGYAIGYLLCDIIVIVKTRYWSYVKIRELSFRTIKELVRYSWPLIPNDISWWVINVSDRSIINYFLGTTANAIYAIAYKVPNLCSSIFGVFNISWQESASESVNDIDRNIFFQSVYDSLLSVIISLCICVLASTFIIFEFLFDARYSSGRLYTSILVISVVFSVVSLFYGGIQISLKITKVNGLSTVTGAIVNILTNIILIHFIGLYAAAVSTLISNIVVCIIRIVKLDRIKLHISRESMILFVILLYYAAISTQRLSIVISVINLVISIIIFIFFNKELILGVVKRMRK